MPKSLSDRSLHYLLVLLVILLYMPSVFFDFTYDDQLAIVGNPLVTAPVHSLSNIGDILVTPYRPGTLYRPLTILSYRANFLFTGLNPATFHLTNIILHCACVLLVFALLRLYFTASAWAFLGAALFAAHPLHVETVANLVGRAELLAAFFGLLYVLGYFHRHHPVLLAALYLLAVLSKESALTVIALAPIFERAVLARREERPRCFLSGFLTTLATAIFYLVLRKMVLAEQFVVESSSEIFTAANPLLGLGVTERLFPAFEYLGRYLMLLTLPINLSADYSLAEPDFWRITFSLVGFIWLKCLVVFLLLLILFRKRPFVYFALWFLVAFSLTANIVLPIGTIFGERLAYLPSIGFIAFSIGAWEYLTLRYKITPGLGPLIAVALCAGYILRSTIRIPVWRSNSELFAQTVIDAPLSPKASFNYGLHLYQLGRFAESEGHFRHASSLMPTNIESIRFLVDVSLKQFRWAQAEFWSRELLKLNPNDQLGREALDQLLRFKTSSSID